MQRLLAILFVLAASQLYAQGGFIPNKGQIADEAGKLRPDILFTALAEGKQFYFTKDRIALVESREDVSAARSSSANSHHPELVEGRILPSGTSPDLAYTIHRSDILLSQSAVRIRYEDPLPGRYNFYFSHCPDGITDVQAYGRIIYEDEKGKTLLTLTHNAGRMEFSSAPGLRLSVKNAEALSVLHPQLALLSKVAEEPNYITDPRVVYSSYLGGTHLTDARGVTLDSKGNAWVVGYTKSYDFPTTDSAMEKTKSAPTSIFISKFSSSGEFLYSTFYAGTTVSQAYAVAVDSEDNVLVTGNNRGGNFPVTEGAFQSKNNGSDEAFLLKLNNEGRRIWATLFGGGGWDQSNAVAIDSHDNIIIAGWSSSGTSFPYSEDAWQKQWAGSWDAFIAKFDRDGNRLWSTLFGGDDARTMFYTKGGDEANAVAIDKDDNIIIAGQAGCPIGFPASADAFQKDSSGGNDMFVAKFSPEGQRLWATLYGSTNDETANDVTTDENDNVIMVGATSSREMPLTSDAIWKTMEREGAGIIVHFSPTGDRQWATYYAGSVYAVVRQKKNTVVMGGTIFVNGFRQTKDSLIMPGEAAGGPYLTSFSNRRVIFSTLFTTYSTYGYDFAVRDSFAVFAGITTTQLLPVTENALMKEWPNTVSNQGFLVILKSLSFDNPDTVKNDSTAELSIYPNPASDYILIGDAEPDMQYSIADQLGRMSPLQPLGGNMIDIRSLATGVYQLYLHEGSRKRSILFIKD